ncbi:MAG: hypothetical protein ACREKQ_13720 [Candidatus Rokuibacteriota bacterium]
MAPHILVVEGSDELRVLITDILMAARYEVTYVAHGAAALERDVLPMRLVVEHS